ncbi:uncharacterized protein LOC131682132 [Topomyia yanbarensis]|uniref:uncharacterized protein LOC131682132 n=1 Tax=Topomyia yanbarensis TaxID=2498891 RepID=UPI00273CCB86|nr:uncharacterized protein LOC131682132 [Topomyia yanbarensis]
MSAPRLKVYPSSATGHYVIFFRTKDNKCLNLLQMSRVLRKLYSAVTEILKIRPDDARKLADVLEQWGVRTVATFYHPEGINETLVQRNGCGSGFHSSDVSARWTLISDVLGSRIAVSALLATVTTISNILAEQAPSTVLPDLNYSIPFGPEEDHPISRFEMY